MHRGHHEVLIAHDARLMALAGPVVAEHDTASHETARLSGAQFDLNNAAEDEVHLASWRGMQAEPKRLIESDFCRIRGVEAQDADAVHLRRLPRECWLPAA